MIITDFFLISTPYFEYISSKASVLIFTESNITPSKSNIIVKFDVK
jgi:hypothetical protein